MKSENPDQNLLNEFMRYAFDEEDTEYSLRNMKELISAGFVIVTNVHRLRSEKRSKTEHDAMILFQMILTKSCAVLHLMDGVPMKHNSDESKLIDPSVIAPLVRAQLEAFALFHNIYSTKNDDNARKFLHEVWQITGLLERQFVAGNPSKEYQEKANKEREIIEQLKLQIKSNPVFLKQNPDNQRKILEWIHKRRYEMVIRKNKISLLSQRDFLVSTGFNPEFDRLYSMLSWYVHPTNISVLKFGQMFEQNFNATESYSFLKFSRMILSMALVEYCNYFPEANRKLEEQPELRQMIVYMDNKVMRLENEFKTPTVEKLMSQLNELVKELKKVGR